MTPTELDDALDAMEKAAAGDGEKAPGLITIATDDWIGGLRDMRPTCSALHDGLRHRNIKVAVSSTFQTAVLTRAEAADRGAPYRDPTPRA